MGNCTCIKQEVGKGSGGVKGFITTQECEECRTKREEANVLASTKRLEQEALAEKEALIQAKIKAIAEAELKTEGKLDIQGNVVKIEEEKLEI